MTSADPKASPRTKAGVRDVRKSLDSCFCRNDGGKRSIINRHIGGEVKVELTGRTHEAAN